jgi:hypothetical protein
MALTAEEKPCWHVICDHCGEGDNDEYGGSYHYPDEQTARDQVRGYEWVVREDGKALCCTCATEAVHELVACPTCGAPRGTECADSHGDSGLTPCQERVDAAVAAL